MALFNNEVILLQMSSCSALMAEKEDTLCLHQILVRVVTCVITNYRSLIKVCLVTSDNTVVMGPTKRHDTLQWPPHAPAPTIGRAQLLPQPVRVRFLVAPIRSGAVSTQPVRMCMFDQDN